jgi:hypothetical protein
MVQPTCEISRQPATFHETGVEWEGAVMRHFGQEHAKSVAPAVHQIWPVCSY